MTKESADLENQEKEVNQVDPRLGLQIEKKGAES